MRVFGNSPADDRETDHGGGSAVWLAVIILGRDVGLAISAIYFRWISLPPPKTMTRYWDFSLPSAEVHPTTISKVRYAQDATFCSALRTVNLALCTAAQHCFTARRDRRVYGTPVNFRRCRLGRCSPGSAVSVPLLPTSPTQITNINAIQVHRRHDYRLERSLVCIFKRCSQDSEAAGPTRERREIGICVSYDSKQVIS